MSAVIVIYCNGEYLEGVCPHQIMLYPTDLSATLESQADTSVKVLQARAPAATR
jgi:hypothetical protein